MTDAARRSRLLFVTGRLAEPSLRRVLEPLAEREEFDFDVAVLPISVAALMHSRWVRLKLQISGEFDRVVLPGWCDGDLAELSAHFGMPFERGPQDLFDLPEHFGRAGRTPPDLSRYDIEILAEINHAPRMTDDEILSVARRYRADGADVIDLGCVPGESWNRSGDVTRMLREDGLRVSIDGFERREVEAAVAAGAELVLSCNGSNVDWASQLDAELVAIPDDPRDFDSLERTVERLDESGSRFRIDPILEPIGFGFAASLGRFLAARRRWPDVEMLMGIGNLTELTETDSAGLSLSFAGFCQELRIRSVLTTEVVGWARTAVREFDVARRIARHSITEQVLPKHVDSRLLMLRDSKVTTLGEPALAELASRLTDPNVRIFVEADAIHVMNRDGHWQGRDPYVLFDRLMEVASAPDASHAFYLGYEMAKAVTALTLGKQYRQDHALRWGLLTVDEISAHERRRGRVED